MANLSETPNFDSGIYQIETTDPVLGGPAGIANVQAKSLANRTSFLKQQIDQLNSGTLTPSWIASESYVQGELQKLDSKQSVRAATTQNTTLSGVQTIDGVALAVGDRVLVKDQTNANQNGIYLVAAAAWTRSADADSGTKLTSGARVAVEEGSINAGRVWYLATVGAISVGSTALQFSDEHPKATQTSVGLMRIATMAEALSGLLDDVAVTPKTALEVAFSAYPVGAPIPWPTAVPPAGFLAMTGQSFSAVTYPKLALAYPDLVLPDMRAEFIRGWDHGRGIDAGRTLLSAQGDAIRNITGDITHTTNDINSSYIPVTSALGALRNRATYNTVLAVSITGSQLTRPAGISFDASLVVPTAADNRPRNTAFNYIVRAA
ncbi:MAG: Aeromonas phage vB AsaM-56 [Pseudomonadota bacterium]|jgi:phage-related tail fiber protein